MAGETVALKTELVLKMHVPLQRMAGNGISTTEGFFFFFHAVFQYNKKSINYHIIL